MELIGAFNRLIAPYARAIRLMIGRAVVTLIDDSQPIQRVQITIMADESHGSVERIQNYGHTSVPFSGAQAVAASICGNRDHLVVIAMDDGRYRPTNLVSGESTLYDDLKQIVYLSRKGIVINSPLQVTVKSPQIVLDGYAKTTNHLEVSTGVSGVFTDKTGQSVTVKNGIIVGGLGS